MKAYKKESKIIFKNSISKCINDIKSIIKKIEDKNNEIFPTQEISNFIKNCDSVVENSENIKIPKDYVDFVSEHKEVYRYFKEREDKINEQTNICNSRREVIDNFKKEVEKYM